MAAAPSPLSVAQLYRRCDPEKHDFRTTDDLAGPTVTLPSAMR